MMGAGGENTVQLGGCALCLGLCAVSTDGPLGPRPQFGA